MSWKRLKICNIGTVITGTTPPSSKPECFGDEFPFITPSDMDGRKIIRHSERGLSDAGAALLKTRRLPKHSVAVSCIGWQMGKVVLVGEPSFTNQQINTIIPNDSVDPDFLYYSLSTKRPELQMLGSVGTRTPILNKSAFEQVQISLPPLETQQQIAAILSAYDDLIENNSRRIKVLEEMAGLVYREWFVNFRFPGHEGVRLVASELGEIPEGWEVGLIEDLASMEHKSVQPDKHPDEVFEYYSFPAFDGGRSPEFTRGDEIKSNKYLVPQNVVLFPKLNLKFPRVWLPYLRGEDRSIASTKYVILQPRGNVKREYLFEVLTQPALLEQAVGTSGGTSTSHQRISPRSFVKTPIIIPTEQVRQAFEAFAVPAYNQIQNLRVKNQNLRRTRDVLLPQLISGELSVSQLGELPETGQAA